MDFRIHDMWAQVLKMQGRGVGCARQLCGPIYCRRCPPVFIHKFGPEA